jgi:2-desacetyl-2-hydroxyethyl bacteriochlorophyllide A dehydrogenase
MRAAIFSGAGQPLRVDTVPDPVPGPGEVVLKVGACGICGTDLLMTSGHGALQAAAGDVLGHEFAGEVIGIGPGCKRLRIGQRVTAMPVVGCGHCPTCIRGEPKWCLQRRSMQGGYAEYLRTGENACSILPANLSLEDGALVEPLAVGLHGVAVAQMPVGARVLIIGAGPVGMAVAFWARRLGASRIAMTASSTRRAELALRLGASVFVTPSPDAVGAVNEALGGAPDIVFECVGAEGMLDHCVRHARPLGTVVVLGCCSVPDPFLPMTALFKETRMLFAALYSMHEFETCIDALSGGAMEARAMITDRVSLDEAPAAFEALRERTHQCKVLIEPWAAFL